MGSICRRADIGTPALSHLQSFRAGQTTSALLLEADNRGFMNPRLIGLLAK
jgi:hypothetical protein